MQGCVYFLFTLFLTYFFSINLYLLTEVYVFLILSCSVYTCAIPFLKNFINYNNCVYTYLCLVYFLFLVSVPLQYYSYSSDFILSFSSDITKTLLSGNSTPISFLFDSVSCSFSCVTVQIAFFVNVYSFFYKKKEYNNYFFFFLINLFFLSMVFLLHSANLIILFLFWECIGLSSFFLINFYNHKSVSFKSSLKAMSFNKISDLSLLSAVVIFYNSTGSVTFDDFNISLFVSSSYTYNFFFISISASSIFLFFIITASFVKSAQIGLHFWLPDSMEAPLPASALIHSATLVASGVYLITRFSYMLVINDFFMSLVILYFSITYVYGAAIASSQTDIKKILAYSTISNCGLMFFSLIAGSRQSGLVFFSTHGWYKSASFLVAGQIVIASGHIQDLRLSAVRNYSLVLQTSYLIITLLNLSSFWFMYCSSVKHLIFQNSVSSFFVHSFLVLGSLFSYSYSMRIIFFLLSESFNVKKPHRTYIIYEVYNICVYVMFITLFTSFFSSVSGVYKGLQLNKTLVLISVYTILLNVHFFKA